MEDLAIQDPDVLAFLKRVLAYQDGSLEAAALQALEDELLDSEPKRRWFVEMQVRGQCIAEVLQRQASRTELPEVIGAAPKVEQTRAEIIAWNPEAGRVPSSPRWGVVAIFLFTCLGLGAWGWLRPHSPVDGNPSPGLTMVVWLNPSAITPGSLFTLEGADNSLFWEIEPSGGMRLHAGSLGSFPCPLPAERNPTQAVCLAVVLDPTRRQIRHFLNGQQIAEQEFPAGSQWGGSEGVLPSSNHWRIGAGASGFTLSPRALSSQELKQLVQRGR